MVFNNPKQFLRLIYLMVFFAILVSCNFKIKVPHKSEPQTRIRVVQNNADVKISLVQRSCEELEQLLNEERYDDFYEQVKHANKQSIELCLAKKAERGAFFNYGVLFNAGLIKKQNKQIYKPNLNIINGFPHVKNDGKCFMNAPLYAIASSEFFDSLLEIDAIYPDLWQARPQENLSLANDVLHSLREVIYEIRRGQHTNAQRIATMRDRHFNSFAHLDEVPLLLSLYYELLTSYVFENVIYAYADNKGTLYKEIVSLHAQIAKESIVNQQFYSMLHNFRALRGVPFGPLNALVRLPGNQDLVYLDSLFAIIDPWGMIARYLSFIFYADTNNNKVIYHPSYASDMALRLNSGNKDINLRVFFDDINLDNYGLHVRTLRDPKLKNASGKIIYKLAEAMINRLNKLDQGLLLRAKTKHSHNHQIAELFNPMRKEWETHFFDVPPIFSKILSQENGVFYDQLSFYEINEAKVLFE